MANPVSILREIHRLRRHARNLQDEIERLPRLLKAQQARVARQEELLKEAQELLKKLKVATHDREVTLKTAQALIAKYEKQRNETTSRKEYDALNHEIAVTRENCAKIEDQILEAMLKADEQAAKIPELEQELQKAKEECARFEKTSGERQASLAAQLEQALKALKEVEANVPDDVREQYDRVVAARSEDAMSAVVSKTCSACYTEITAQSYNNLLLGQFVLCKACGRILYLPESAGA
jgi:predicted  nucleic acid-binding Zn-ribbon protein